MQIEERSFDADGLRTRYLTAGSGPALVLLHAAGESASDWQWVLPTLARTHRVYAPDLPGHGEITHADATYPPAFFARLVADFLTALGVDRAAVAGNSLGGLIALQLTLSAPQRVTALALLDSAGLGRAIHPSMRALTAPGYGDLAVMWGKTPLGAIQRAALRAPLLFARPERAPAEWYMEQYRLSQLPNFLPATLASLRAQVDLSGQRTVLLDRLPRLAAPTLVVWGANDLIFPVTHARAAIERLRHGYLTVIPECGHLPQVEQPEQCAAALEHFLITYASSSQEAADGAPD